MYKTFDIDKNELNYNYNYNPEETQAIRSKLSANQFTIDDIRRVALWKPNRVIDIPESVMSKLTDLVSQKDLSIDDHICKEVFESLIGDQCHGMRAPMVSTILKFLRPKIFPIIDVRAYRVLYGVKLPDKIKFDVYLNYVKTIYQIRDKFKLPLYEVATSNCIVLTRIITARSDFALK